ncbi:SH3 domain-containing protein [Ichthyenterobacterium magnum]|uniref:Tetratricopeptide repeat protein n=1 Tax=Ichthyenterobacterium magnum TaxID=1230530 RepID=A0A420DWP1_9FLAO|nr:tetratricopeptide repeat protein [Ichthyenterobacterium magnum]RKE98654.1 tetratricopeptide repeat protein [Ichthyenterobacterium magnum]
MKLVFYILTYFISTIAIAQNDALFNEGNALYNNGNYTEALDKYKTILNSGEHSAELYFNIANAHYKLNHIAPSIYNYEKALLLAPNDADIKNNAAFARNMTVDAIDVLPKVGFSKLLSNITHTFSFDVWAGLAVVFILGFVFLFINYYFSNYTSSKRMSFVFSSLCLLLSLVALSFAFHKYNLDDNYNPAIVFAQASDVKSEPNLRSDEAFQLHEGTKVQVLDSVNDWRKIKLSDGKTGWIISDDIKLIKNF